MQVFVNSDHSKTLLDYLLEPLAAVMREQASGSSICVALDWRLLCFCEPFRIWVREIFRLSISRKGLEVLTIC